MNILDNTKIDLSHNNKEVIRIRGFDMGAKMPILYRLGDFMVFKRVGHTGWSGIGQTSYYPPDYYLVELEQREDGLYLKRVIEEHEASRSTWRGILRDLTDRANKLSWQSHVSH